MPPLLVPVPASEREAPALGRGECGGRLWPRWLETPVQGAVPLGGSAKLCPEEPARLARPARHEGPLFLPSSEWRVDRLQPYPPPPPPGKTQRPRGDPPGCLGAGVSLHLGTAAPPAFGDGQAVVLPQGLRATPHDRPVSQMQMLPSCEGRDCPLGGRAGTIFRPPGLWPMYSATAAAQGRTGSDQAASWPLSSCHLATGISVTVRCALWAL